ncbi:MAG: acyltransferase family protein [Lysobacter sp.]
MVTSPENISGPLTPRTRGQRVNELDLLRFVAAMIVVIFHYAFRGYAADDRSIMPYPLLAPIAKYGFMGVEMFFLISGFVILMSASHGTLKSFAISRFVRLYPAFWACCTLTFVTILLLGGSRYSATFSQYLANMTMLSGFAHVPSIDGVYWSLFIEIQFYALVALVVAARRIHRAQLLLTLWLLATLALEIFPIGPLRFLLLTSYSAYFIAGATCFLIWTHGLSRHRLCIVATCLLFGTYQALGNLKAFEAKYETAMSRPVVIALIATFFVIMLLVATRRMGSVAQRNWAMAGALTYPLYLLHQNIGFMLFNVAYPAINQHVLFWGAVLVMIGMSYAVHVLVEKRFAPVLKRVSHRVWDATTRQLSRLRLQLLGI